MQLGHSFEQPQEQAQPQILSSGPSSLDTTAHVKGLPLQENPGSSMTCSTHAPHETPRAWVKERMPDPQLPNTDQTPYALPSSRIDALDIDTTDDTYHDVDNKQYIQDEAGYVYEVRRVPHQKDLIQVVNPDPSSRNGLHFFGKNAEGGGRHWG